MADAGVPSDVADTVQLEYSLKMEDKEGEGTTPHLDDAIESRMCEANSEKIDLDKTTADDEDSGKLTQFVSKKENQGEVETITDTQETEDSKYESSDPSMSGSSKEQIENEVSMGHNSNIEEQKEIDSRQTQDQNEHVSDVTETKLTSNEKEQPGNETIKTAADILKLPGPDKYKFEKLAELNETSAISSKEFVDTLLGLVTGSPFDLDNDFIISNGDNILHMMDLMNMCSDKQQAELWSLFSAGVRRNTINLQACVSIGLTEKILSKMYDYDNMLAEILVDLLCVLSSYSISVKELQLLFSLLQARNGRWPRHSTKLLRILHQMPQQSGPNEFFSFPGQKGSVIALPPLAKWPHQNGFTFHCWFRLDPVVGGNNDRDKPYIFCFRTGKGLGYSGHFFGNAFVITAIKTKGKGFQHCVKYDFQPREWNMVTLAFVYNRWTTSELNCYVNGQLVSHADISWFVSTNDVFDKCYLGSSAEMEEATMFCGQMSSVYLFSETLTVQQVEALYLLGPDHSSNLKFVSGVRLPDTAKQVLYDGKLSSAIVFLYTPVACNGQLCLNSYPKGNQSYFLHSPHALILGDTKPCITHSVYSSLHSIGGIQVFFPLFEQLDLVEESEPGAPGMTNYGICTSLVRLLYKLLFGSLAIQQQLLQNRGFLVLGYLFEKSSKAHLTSDVLDAFVSMVPCLMASPTTGPPLIKHLFDYILLNPALWINASFEVQRNLYSILRNFIDDPSHPLAAHRISYVVQTMHKLMYFYWVVQPSSNGIVMPKVNDEPRPSKAEIMELRALMLECILQLAKKESKIEDEELQSIINYLITVQEDENLLDVLRLLVQLMAELPASLVPAFDRTAGIKVIFKLLSSPNEKIRIQALKLLGFFLARSKHKRKHETMGMNNLYMLIGDRLMLHSSFISMETYNILFEILTEHMTDASVTDRHPIPDVSFRIENSLMLKVISHLIRQSKNCAEVIEVKRQFLSDLMHMCVDSRENRRIILQMSVWQDWLLSLAYIHPVNEEQQKVTGMVMSLFHLLLFHAVRQEVGGWRVWIDTQAILHSKVSYEEFRARMAQLYNQCGQTLSSEQPNQRHLTYGAAIPGHPSGDGVDGAMIQHENGHSAAKSPSLGKLESESAPESGDHVEEKLEKAGLAEYGGNVTSNQEDAERMVKPEGQSNSSSESEKDRALQKLDSTSVRSSAGSGSGRQVFSPGPRAPAFSIPEFRWSPLHLKLLADLIASFETEIEGWKVHTTRTVIDSVNAPENLVFATNITQIISQLSDNLISSCGGLLPLLAAATSSTGEVEGLESGRGFSAAEAGAFLQRLIAMADILIFASNLDLGDLEQEKMMNSGGILRQCLRLVCTGVVRNCLEIRLRDSLILYGKLALERIEKGILDLILGTHSSFSPGDSVDWMNVFGILKEDNGTIKDPEKLLQDIDINRLRAAIYRNTDATKQSQFLALAVIYFLSVLMVSKYRDLLETPPNSSAATSSARASRSSSTGSVVREEEEHKQLPSPSLLSTKTAPSTDAVTESEVKQSINQSTKAEELGNAEFTKESDKDSDENDTEMKDKDIQPSSNAAESEGHATPTGEVKESEDADTAEKNTLSSPKETGVDSPVDGRNHEATIQSITVGDHSELGGNVEMSNAQHQPFSQENLPKSMEIRTSSHVRSGELMEKLERVLGPLAPLVREIFLDFGAFLSKTLVGSHGQDLVSGGMVTLKNSTSVVELVMLLCSQEWQNSLQKFAGLAFVELVNEGRLSASATQDHIVRVANEAEFILNRLRADDIQKHSDFQNVCKKLFLERLEEMKLYDHLLTSSHIRDQMAASQLCEKVRDILAIGCRSQTDDEQKEKVDFWKLDKWEDDSRRRRRFIRNPFGSRHEEAVYDTSLAEDTDGNLDSIGCKTFPCTLTSDRMQGVSADSATDDDILQSDDRDLEDLAGVVTLSTACKLISPGAVVHGTMSITKTELHFEINLDDTRNKKISPEVLHHVEYLHSKWHFREIRAIFSRRYRLQNVAVEIFVANRTAVMFAFEDFSTVKRVVGALPQVGIGVKYGLPQTRRVSLASPRQIFKMSNMTQRWQQKEVSNFDYLMFLNTVAGRTYCDLSQYPVFPWVVTNYDSPELDLNSTANYRDFSKPVGALNPTRNQYFEERYAKWKRTDIPPCHYDTHYSTALSTLNWLIRLEPFTTFFLSQHHGKFPHPKKMFHSVAQSWRNCFLDATDVRELTPEFFYLPEMFVNMNGYDLGTGTDGQQHGFGDVELPPWAKSPEDFVRIMRMALESEIISTQLNQWIDLIFGYRQRGPEAVRALNVFHHLSYEGNVNWDVINDLAAKQALEDDIFRLGQTPSQLLTEPHPPRISALSPMPLLTPTIARDDVCMIMKFLSNSPVVHVSSNTHPAVPIPAVITITASYNFAVNKWDHIGANAQLPVPGYKEGGQQPLQLPLAMDPLLGLSRRSLGDDSIDQRAMAGQSTFIVTADNRFILATGFMDKSFRVFSTESGSVWQMVFGHYDLVTCICRSECGISQDCYIVTGSRDCTVMIWHWNAKQQIIAGDGTNPNVASSKAILVGHQSEIKCVTVSSELGIVISGSEDGLVLMHSITGELIRSFHPTSDAGICQNPKLLVLSREGSLLVCYDKGTVFSFGINGKPLAHFQSDDDVKAMTMSRDGQFLILGGHKGSVGVWRGHDLIALYTYPACDSPIQSLNLSNDQRFLMAGLASGCLIVFHIDFTKWLEEYQKLERQ